MSAHIVVDLETYDTRPSAVVLSIGVAIFDDSNDAFQTTEFNLAATIDKQIRDGRTVSASTIDWWAKQSAEARRVFSSSDHVQAALYKHVNVAQTLRSLSDFCTTCARTKDFFVWGNGVGFDNVILRSLYETYECEPFWTFWQDRCFRTLRAANEHIPFESYGTKHVAVDDAMAEAIHLRKILTDASRMRAIILQGEAT